MHYYNTDHQGNIREVVNENGILEQVTHYYPFGTPFTDGSALNPGLQPYKYNGKELDLMHGLNTYDYGARQYDPLLVTWHGVDALCEKYYLFGPYVYCMGNPVRFIDTDGKDVWLFATELPDIHLPMATHTFLVVTGENGNIMRYAAYGPQNNWPFGGDKLVECHYLQDIQVYTDFFQGKDNDNLMGIPQKVDVPKGMQSQEFDRKVIQTINSFGNLDGITYSLLGGGADGTSGNCNTSSSTILIKSGVDKKQMESLERNIQGINTGFKTCNPKPWTKEEQKRALENKSLINDCNILQKPL